MKTLGSFHIHAIIIVRRIIYKGDFDLFTDDSYRNINIRLRFSQWRLMVKYNFLHWNGGELVLSFSANLSGKVCWGSLRCGTSRALSAIHYCWNTVHHSTSVISCIIKRQRKNFNQKRRLRFAFIGKCFDWNNPQKIVNDSTKAKNKFTSWMNVNKLLGNARNIANGMLQLTFCVSSCLQKVLLWLIYINQ